MQLGGGLRRTRYAHQEHRRPRCCAAQRYANKLNPTCSVCPTSPTASEPTGCPKYTTPRDGRGPGSFPGVGFDSTYDLGATQNQPIYIPNDVIIPTLDDAPDGADDEHGAGGQRRLYPRGVDH